MNLKDVLSPNISMNHEQTQQNHPESEQQPHPESGQQGHEQHESRSIAH